MCHRSLVVAFALLLASTPAAAQSYDLLIRNGSVIDGTGQPPPTIALARL